VLPYSAEALASLFAQYGQAVRPMQAAGLMLGLALLGAALSGRAWAGRAAAVGLALAWGWVAIAWFLGRMAGLDFMAPVYAGVFLLQAALLLWSAFAGRLAYAPAGRLGLGVALAALLLPPAWALAAGGGLAAAPVFLVAPGPTVVVTLGLLAAARPPPLYLGLVPLLWAGVAGFQGWVLGMTHALLLAAAIVAALALALWQRWRLPA